MTRINRHRSTTDSTPSPNPPFCVHPPSSTWCNSGYPSEFSRKILRFQASRRCDVLKIFLDSNTRRFSDHSFPTPGTTDPLCPCNHQLGGGGTFAACRPSCLARSLSPRSSFISISVSNSVMHANQEATGAARGDHVTAALPSCHHRCRRRRPASMFAIGACKARRGRGEEKMRREGGRTPN